jgi:hypothetical protein
MARNMHNMQDYQDKDPYLNFRLLDGTMKLSAIEQERIIDTARPHRIGPLVEYTYQNLTDAHLRLQKWRTFAAPASLCKALSKNSLYQFQNDSSITPHQVEFFRIPQNVKESDEPRWMAFCKRLERAGSNAGLFSTFAAALAGTFGEMQDNALQHSEHPHTAIVGYRWTTNEFEYVVSDAGIGVLASLKKNPDCSSLEDSGEALLIAIEDGQSRHGKGSGHGTGFHKLIHNIARHGSFLRFRSGDHCLIVDGVSKRFRQYTQPCSPFPGFLISAICQVSNQ